MPLAFDPDQMTRDIARFHRDRSDAAFLEICGLPTVAEHERITVLQQIDHRVVIVNGHGLLEIGQFLIADLERVIELGVEILRHPQIGHVQQLRRGNRTSAG